MVIDQPNDKELEALRRKRLQELMLQEELQRQQEELMEAQLKSVEAQRQAILRQILTPEAKERLGRVRLARPDLVALIEQQLIALAQSGKLRTKIDDNELKSILLRLSSRREIKIERR